MGMVTEWLLLLVFTVVRDCVEIDQQVKLVLMRCGLLEGSTNELARAIAELCSDFDGIVLEGLLSLDVKAFHFSLVCGNGNRNASRLLTLSTVSECGNAGQGAR